MTKLRNLVLAGVLTHVLMQDVESAQWARTNGPYGGHITSFAASPAPGGTDGTYLFAADGTRGVWLSTDYGTTWNPASTGLPRQWDVPIYALAANSTRVFAGTYFGVYATSDNGGSWTAVKSTSAGQGVHSLAVSGTKIFAGAYGVVYVSTDNGASWSTGSAGLPGSTHVLALAVSGSDLFAAAGGSVFKSTDDGASWVSSGSGLPRTSTIHSLAVSGASLFAGTDVGIYRSTNGAATWSGFNNGLPVTSWPFNVPPSVGPLAVSGAYLFAGTDDGVWRSTTGAANWISRNDGVPYNYSHALCACPAPGGDGNPLVFIGTIGGVFRTSDDGATWNPSSKGMAVNPVNAIVMSTASAGGSGANLFVATSGGVYLSANDGDSWTGMTVGLSYGVVALAHNGTHLFAAPDNNGVFRSTDNGGKWSSASSGLGNYDVISLATGGTYLYAGTHFTDPGIFEPPPSGVYVSSNNGTSWAAASGIPRTTVQAIFANGAVVLAGTTSGLYRSTDHGWVWGPVSSVPSSRLFTCFALVGTRVFAAAYAEGLFCSSDSGVTWTSARPGWMSTDVHSMAVRGNTLFVATGGGIYVTSDNGTNWTAVTMGAAEGSISVIAAGGTYLFGGGPSGTFWRRPLSEMVTAVPLAPGDVPEKFTLEQNYPNPFNPSTTIQYELPRAAHVRLTVCTILGQTVRTLVEESQPAGIHTVRFDATGLAGGVYLYRLQAENSVTTRKLMVLR